MATNNLFSFPGQSQGNKSALVEFKAGKMTYENKKVTPDKRKGLVQLTQSPDSLIHFIWKDRTSGRVEDDLIIFPEEATFKKVTQPAGRVFYLEFKVSSKRHFFWMQESKADKDDEYCTKINEFINNPPNPEQGGSSGASGGGIDQNALFQMFGGRQPSSGSPSQPRQPAPQSAAQNLAVNDLQSILSGMGMPASTLSNLMQQQGRQPAPQQTAPAPQPGASLSQIVNADSVIPLLTSNPQIVEQLLPLLPEGRRTPEEIQHVLRSPQFHQSLAAFSDALQSGQLTDLIRQFNIQTTGGPQTIESFLQSLQSQSGQSNTGAQQGEKKEKKDDDKMDTQ